MEGWNKVNSFDRLHQAEIRKDLLKENEIEAVILTKKDSTFLWGEIELYVEEKNLEKARKLIDEFQGWTKVVSFVYKSPLKRLQYLLKSSGIPSKLLAKKQYPYLLDKYELHIHNNDLSGTRELLAELPGWKHIDSTAKISQTILRFEMLEKNGIQSLITKQCNSDIHLEEIQLYVAEEQAKQALTIIKSFESWEKIESFTKYHRADIHETLLLQKGIKAAILIGKYDEDKEPEQVDLLVKKQDVETAKDMIAQNTKWIIAGTYDRIHQAEIRRDMLIDNGVHAVVIPKKDSSFLLGEIELYVEETDLQQAENLLILFSHIEQPD